MADQIEMKKQISIIFHKIGDLGDIQLNYDKTINEICDQLRETFHSVQQLQRYTWSDDTIQPLQTIKFEDYMKNRLLQTCSEEDRNIIEQWKSIMKYNRERTHMDKMVIFQKKNIYDRITKRYKYIILKTFGPTCARCKSIDKKSYTTNCNCKTGICHECLESCCVIVPDTNNYIYKCYECRERITTFKDVKRQSHSLKTLFFYDEPETTIDEDDAFLHIQLKTECNILFQKKMMHSYIFNRVKNRKQDPFQYPI